MSPIDHLVAEYGYATVALFITAEGLGIPLPGETALIAGAALSARGDLSLAWVITAAALGVIAGGCGGYWIGRTGGQAFIVRYGKWFGIREHELNDTRAFFTRHGTAAVALGRFLPLIRILVGQVAGITEMPFWRFMLVNAIAGTAWAIVFGVLGYEFSHDMVQLQRRFGGLLFVVFVGLAIAGFAVFKWRERQRALRGKPTVGAK